MVSFCQIGYLGRLGNQMFQFASTLGIARKLGFEARFPSENFTTYEKAGPFDFSTNSNSEIKCDLFECFEISEEYRIPISEIRRDAVYREIEFGYNKETEGIRDNTILSGYFQSEKYFSHCRDLILSQFSFREEYKGPATEYVETIKKSNPDKKLISMHIRRGDYVLFPDHHPVCSREYYTSSEAIISKDLHESIFIVFSDDTDWCKTEFSGSRYIICDLGNPYVELCAMTLCDHHIIANSSFSWWGAWLNRKKDKTVIAPSRWFGSMINKDTSDVYCKNWIKN